MISGAIAMLATGCSQTLSIGEAYYPSWLVCMTSGVFGAMIIRAFLVKKGRDRDFGPRALAYPSLAVLIALLVWLIFFRS